MLAVAIACLAINPANCAAAISANPCTTLPTKASKALLPVSNELANSLPNALMADPAPSANICVCSLANSNCLAYSEKLNPSVTGSKGMLIFTP